MTTQYIEHPETKEKIPFEWNQDTPPTSDDIQGLFEAVKGQSVAPITQGEGYFSRLGGDVNTRMNAYNEIEKQPITGFEKEIAAVGTGFGMVKDVISQGLKSAYRIIPRQVRTGIETVGGAIINAPIPSEPTFGENMPGASLGDIIKTGVEGYGKFSKENPRTANVLNTVGNAVDLGTQLSMVNPLVRGAGSLTGKAANVLEASGVKKVSEDALKMVKRKVSSLTPAEQETLMKTNKITESGIFKNAEIKTTPQDIELAKSVEGIVDPRKSPIENIDRITTKRIELAEQTKTLPQMLDGAIDTNEIKGLLEGLKKSSSINFIGDTALESAYNKAIETFMDILSSKPKTIGNVLEARKEYDIAIKEKYADAFKPNTDARGNVIKQAALDVRKAANNFVEGALPEGNEFKGLLKEQTNLYMAAENISKNNLPIIEKNKFQRVLGLITRHPWMSAEIGVAAVGGTAIGIGGAAASVVTNPIALGALMTYGTYKIGKTVLTSDMVRNGLIDFLRVSERILRPAEKVAVEKVIYSLPSTEVKSGAFNPDSPAIMDARKQAQAATFTRTPVRESPMPVNSIQEALERVERRKAMGEQPSADDINLIQNKLAGTVDDTYQKEFADKVRAKVGFRENKQNLLALEKTLADEAGIENKINAALSPKKGAITAEDTNRAFIRNAENNKIKNEVDDILNKINSSGKLIPYELERLKALNMMLDVNSPQKRIIGQILEKETRGGIATTKTPYTGEPIPRGESDIARFNTIMAKSPALRTAEDKAFLFTLNREGTGSYKMPNPQREVILPAEDYMGLREATQIKNMFDNSLKGKKKVSNMIEPQPLTLREATQSAKQPEIPAAESTIPKPGATPGKQPWEMTQREAIADGLNNVGSVKGNYTFEKYQEILGDKQTGSNSIFAKEHKKSVEQALSEGKPVPSEVLKDYPDLANLTESAKLSPVAEKPGTANIPPETTPKAVGGNWKSDMMAGKKLPSDLWLHGSETSTLKLGNKGNFDGAIFLTKDPEFSLGYAQQKAENVHGFKLNNNAKVLSVDDYPAVEKFADGLLKDQKFKTELMRDDLAESLEQYRQKLIDSIYKQDIHEHTDFESPIFQAVAKKLGYDAIESNQGLVVINSKKALTPFTDLPNPTRPPEVGGGKIDLRTAHKKK
jgi:hypothetical protein